MYQALKALVRHTFNPLYLIVRMEEESQQQIAVGQRGQEEKEYKYLRPSKCVNGEFDLLFD